MEKGNAANLEMVTLGPYANWKKNTVTWIRSEVSSRYILSVLGKT